MDKTVDQLSGQRSEEGKNVQIGAKVSWQSLCVVKEQVCSDSCDTVYVRRG